ncbi:hypothetical protein HDU93_003834, partial [Gonapodya sp. JEL0774]
MPTFVSSFDSDVTYRTSLTAVDENVLIIQLGLAPPTVIFEPATSRIIEANSDGLYELEAHGTYTVVGDETTATFAPSAPPPTTPTLNTWEYNVLRSYYIKHAEIARYKQRQVFPRSIAGKGDLQKRKDFKRK